MRSISKNVHFGRMFMPITRYPLNNDENNSISARLLYVTYSKFENDWPSLVHTHYFTELCYIKGGQGIYLIEDSRYPVRRDDFIIINANVAHTEMSDGDSPLEYHPGSGRHLLYVWGGQPGSHYLQLRKGSCGFSFLYECAAGGNGK